jgi:hypothetical protein
VEGVWEVRVFSRCFIESMGEEGMEVIGLDGRLKMWVDLRRVVLRRAAVDDVRGIV